MGSFGDVDGVSGFYSRHDVRFNTLQTSHIGIALSNAACPLLGVFSKSLLDPVPARTVSTEEIPVAA